MKSLFKFVMIACAWAIGITGRSAHARVTSDALDLLNACAKPRSFVNEREDKTPALPSHALMVVFAWVIAEMLDEQEDIEITPELQSLAFTLAIALTKPQKIPLAWRPQLFGGHCSVFRTPSGC